MKIGRLLLRTVVGGLFVGHGTQKLFGWFGGQGLDATAQGFESMGLRPGKVNAAVAGAGEALGGAALVAGYRTPLAAGALTGAMLTAIKRVHLKNGPWAHKGGYEYNLVLLAAAISLAESGPGPISLDALRHKERQGLIWGLLAVGLGVGGAAAVEALASAKAPIPAPEASAPAAATSPEPATASPEPAAAPEPPLPPVADAETEAPEPPQTDESSVTDAEVAGDEA